MEPRAWTDLETAIEGWRTALLRRGVWPREVDELEEHLRSLVDDFVAQGHPAREAFQAADLQMGDPDAIRHEMHEGRRPRTILGRTVGLLEGLSGGLLANYARVIARRLRRDRGFVAISVLGLGVGIALCLLLLAHVRFERQYDNMHDKADRVFRVAKGDRATTPGLWGPELEIAFPEVTTAVRVMDNQFGRAVFRIGDTSLRTGPGLVADAGLFEAFSWTLSQGDPDGALDAPGSLVISRELAQTLFGSENAVGQALSLDGAGDFPAQTDLMVTGILADPEGPSHLDFDFVVSMATVDALDRAGDWGTPFSWTNPFVKTYILLGEGADPNLVQERFPAFIESHVASERYAKTNVFLQPLRTIHLRSRLRFDPPGSGGVQLVYLLVGLSVLVLAIAIANFVNLAVARSLQRAREIGLRKAVGADRVQLVTQFLGESVGISLVATLLAVPVLYAARPTFETLTGRPLPLSAVLDWWSVPSLAALGLLVGLIAGGYPAVMLSRLQTAKALRSGLKQLRTGTLSRVLVVGQFVVSIALISVAIIFARQMSFVAERDLGFSPEGVFLIPVGQSDRVSNGVDGLAQRLENYAAIQAVGASHSFPSSFLNQFSYLPAGADRENRISMGSLSIGAGFFETLGTPFVSGRPLRPQSGADSSGFVVNQAALARLGLTDPEEAVGSQIEWVMPGLGFTGPILGVIGDFHFGSLRDDIPPIVFHVTRFGVNYLMVRARPSMLSEAIASATAEWQALEPVHAFEFELMDDRIGAQYNRDQRMVKIFGLAAGIAILLACLGLFGLTAFLAERRRTEVGVRRVLGATTGSLLLLFCRDTINWVGLALLIAVPIAWMASSNWLSEFAYRVSPGMAPFIAAGIIALIVASAAVSLQTLKVVLTAPTVSLRGS